MSGVSFILPMYMGEGTLPGCLERLRAQSLRDWECIGVDDASPDRSADIFQRVAAVDPRLQLVRHTENRGVAAARATGLQHARGYAVHLLDQDDHLSRDGIRHLWRRLHSGDSAPAVYGDYELVDVRSGRRRTFEEFPPQIDFDGLLQGPPFCPLAVLHRRTAVEAAGGFTPGFDSCDDWDLWARLTRLGQPLAHHSTLVGEWRVHAANNSRNALRTLTSGLKVLDAMHRPDPRVAHPDPRWRDGAEAGGRPRWALRLLWLQVANCVAQRNSEAALALVDEFERAEGRGLLSAESAAEIHPAMVFARLLAGDEPASYFLDLEPTLVDFFARLEVRCAVPGLADRALLQLRERYVRSLLEANAHLTGLVRSYRISRSYRLGRFLTRLARGRLRS